MFAALLVAAAVWLNGSLGGALATPDVIGAIVALLLVGRYIDPLLEVAGYGDARAARGQLDAIRELFAVQPLPETDTPQAPGDAAIELRGLHFRYAPDAAEVLRGIDLRIAPGSMTALIGPSGSGKTTLARLIARFFDASQGSVLIGGVDVRRMSGAQLAGQLGQIFQDSYLFTGSIADNIRVGKPDATEAELMQAARQAGVTEIVARLPQGMDTRSAKAARACRAASASASPSPARCCSRMLPSCWWTRRPPRWTPRTSTSSPRRWRDCAAAARWS